MTQSYVDIDRDPDAVSDRSHCGVGGDFGITGESAEKAEEPNYGGRPDGEPDEAAIVGNCRDVGAFGALWCDAGAL